MVFLFILLRVVHFFELGHPPLILNLFDANEDKVAVFGKEWAGQISRFSAMNITVIKPSSLK